ncbi:MAG: PrsW family intramembrane metalloprotease [Gammaproteobacteria bacterium]|nr:PrsW family intramembrane metalloprotease [Gammaproteobacteria bacterium]MDH4311435.1 PrsW family intramembrane metalloprotease [Gammaproteobacteria bacterium]
MILQWVLRGTMALLPVLVFLGALIYFDSFKVVRAKAIIIAAAAGMLAAFAGYWINGLLLDRIDIGYVPYSRWISPWLEESLKAALIVYLIRTRRVGMLVDAAIYGFAVGTGFALFENLYFLMMRPETHPAVQVIRGFGTAIMHGGATAVFAIAAVSQAERYPDKWLRVFLPGLVGAVILHGVYNTLLVRPVFATLGVLMLLPPLIYFAFENSEKALRDWLESDLDSDVQLIETINAGEFLDSHAGRYVHSLQDKFDGPVLADMLCYLRLHCELALRAKGVLMLRESGFEEPPFDDELRAQIAELRYLERSLGKSGQLALRPILMATGKDLWQLQWLQH